MPLKINRKINRKCSNIHQSSEMFVDFFKLVGSHVLAVVHIHVIYIYMCELYVCVVFMVFTGAIQPNWKLKARGFPAHLASGRTGLSSPTAQLKQ